MKKITTFYISLLAITLIILASCATQPSIVGLWKNTGENGTIEFKTNGEVTIIDNMSATVLGHYKIKNNDLIEFELVASDILRDSVQPIAKIEITAKIIKLNDDSLQLHFAGENKTENYKRIR